MMAARCGNSWGGWRGGVYIPGGGEGLLTKTNIVDLRSELLSRDPGSIGRLSAASDGDFITLLQHVDDGVNPAYCRLAAPFFFRNLSGIAVEVDLTDSAELNVVSGSAPTFSGGLLWAGDCEFEFLFMGPEYRQLCDIYLEHLIRNASSTPGANSVFGVGWRGAANARTMSGAGYSSGWRSGGIVDTSVSIDTILTWTGGAMPATLDRGTSVIRRIPYSGGTQGLVLHFHYPHVGGAGSRHNGVITAASNLTHTKAGFYVSAGPASLEGRLEVISNAALDIPALDW